MDTLKLAARIAFNLIGIAGFMFIFWAVWVMTPA